MCLQADETSGWNNRHLHRSENKREGSRPLGSHFKQNQEDELDTAGLALSPRGLQMQLGKGWRGKASSAKRNADMQLGGEIQSGVCAEKIRLAFTVRKTV